MKYRYHDKISRRWIKAAPAYVYTSHRETTSLLQLRRLNVIHLYP
nr:MAG TPA: hypothetical protein [Caudoviricetes sp.]